MEASASSRISLSCAVQTRGPTGVSGRYLGFMKFCNGEFMGRKLKLTQLEQQGRGNSACAKNGICMSLATDVASESKVSLILLLLLCYSNKKKDTNRKNVSKLSRFFSAKKVIKIKVICMNCKFKTSHIMVPRGLN